MLNEVAEECRAHGALSATAIRLDLTSHSDALELANLIEQTPGSPTVLVNNAGSAVFGEVLDQPWEAIERQLTTNLLGTISVTHALLPQLGPGSMIINILSIAAQAVLPGAAAYSAAKAGAHQFFKVLRQEVRSKGIRVTNILPGATMTPVWEGATWQPDPSDMMTVEGLAATVLGIIHQHPQQSLDELTVLPIKGIL